MAAQEKKPEYYHIINCSSMIQPNVIFKFQNMITAYRQSHDVKEVDFDYFWDGSNYHCVATFCCYGVEGGQY